MELSELTAYASEKYQIREQHKWTDFPGFSVLSHPQTGKWIALLMRQWDGEIGEEIQRCDLKCGSDSLRRFQRPYLTPPIRMRGKKWIAVAFDDRTERDIVFRLFDEAFAAENQHGYLVELEPQAPAGDGSHTVTVQLSGGGYRADKPLPDKDSYGTDTPLTYGDSHYTDTPLTYGDSYYTDTPLPSAGHAYRLPKEMIPKRLHQMRRLYEYEWETAATKAKNFYRQAVFMQDYEDDLPWQGDFVRYFPTYHDLTTRQLRGYFTWRTNLRRGRFEPIAASAAYIYVYELLNGIGANSPEDTLRRLREFETGFVDAGYGDVRMRSNLRRWRLEYAVLQGLPQQEALREADPDMAERDAALAALKEPDQSQDEEVFSALCFFSTKKLEKSPVLAHAPERGKRLFAEAWRAALSYRRQEKDLFTLCFGRRLSRQWHPLSNVVYYEPSGHGETDYELNACRSFHCRGGVWYMESYEKLFFDRSVFQGFVHETETLLRRYLKTGRYLKENPEDAWAIPYIEAVISADRKALEEAARPKVTIDFASLAQIRSDAEQTRDSLLAEEELDKQTRGSLPAREEPDGPGYEELADLDGHGYEEIADPDGHGYEEIADPDEHRHEELADLDKRRYEENENPAAPPVSTSSGQVQIPLDDVHLAVMQALLDGRDASEIIRANRLLPSMVADAVNEAFYDEIGDTVLLCEEDSLLLVEDYLEDVRQLLAGS